MVLNWKVGLILSVGVCAASTAAIFTRLAFDAAGTSGAGISLVLAASRLTIAALILLPSARKFPELRVNSRAIYYAGVAGIFLALHFATWISSLSYTSITASTTLVATNPLWVTLFSWLWFKEKPSLLTITGVGIAVFGAIAIGFGNSQVQTATSQPLLGNALALMGACAASLYLLWGREAQKLGLSIGAYITVAYTTAAVILLPLPIIFGSSYIGHSSTFYLYVLLMALFPQLIGHTSFNWAMRSISPTLVALTILFEPICSSFLGYLIYREVPGVLEFIGAGVLLIGVALAIVGARRGNR
ncbi:MAG: DMT family transporter [Mastigocoleus sp. MO_167.B18]|nr:DMT family transporter [Mastigocoleus sp. MO_167.B18]